MQSDSAEKTSKPPRAKKRSRWRIVGYAALVLIGILIAARIALPTFVRWYVNRTIDRSPIYNGEIGDVEIHLWRGAYSITDVRLVKTTGNVPVPLFSAKRVDLAIQWNALMSGKIVGQIVFDEPQINFVDAGDDSQSQVGAGGPWLGILRDLFPFQINSAQIHNGSIHFHAYQHKPQVDVYLDQLEASIENLTNVRNEVTPNIATVKATALAMDQAKFEYEMKLNPSSYLPTFELAVRLLGLDLTQTNDLARAYGGIDFEGGSFDLVIELDAKHGQLEGYVKPLFRDLKIFSLKQDVREDNPLELFWEAVVGATAELLKNQPHNQLATVIPLRGQVSGPAPDILVTVGNILRNAFIRAYMPRLEGVAQDVNGLEFGRGSIVEPPAVGDEK